MLIPFFIKEGLENFSGHHDHDEEHEEHDERHDEHAGAYANVIRRVCFCLSCWFGLSACRAVCCRA